MEELLKTFRKEDIDEPIVASFDPVINKTRIISYQGDMYITPTKIYLLPRSEADMAVYYPKCIAISEIDSWKKYGLAGFQFNFKDGSQQLFSNVGRKMREGIIAAIEAQK